MSDYSGGFNFNAVTLKGFFLLYVRRSAKILILNKEGIIEKISYERGAYESVDEKIPLLDYVPKNDEKKKEFKQ